MDSDLLKVHDVLQKGQSLIRVSRAFLELIGVDVPQGSVLIGEFQEAQRIVALRLKQERRQ